MKASVHSHSSSPWRGERERLTRADYLAQTQQGEPLSPAARELLAAL